MGTLDASLIFFLPLGIDFVVIIMAARKPELFWLYALLATIGSVTGAGLTYWIGRKAGEPGLRRFLNPRTLARVQKRVETQAALPIAALGVIPPPFPFTAFVLAAGAWKLSAWKFLSALGGRPRRAVRGRNRAGRPLRQRDHFVDGVDDVHDRDRGAGGAGGGRDGRLGRPAVSERTPQVGRRCEPGDGVNVSRRRRPVRS